MRKVGRPPKDIPPEQIVTLAKLGATVKEIAEFFHCSDEVITRRFQYEVEEGRSTLKMNIRRAQLRLALEKDNATMLIWLGKQILKQVDKPVEEETNISLTNLEKKTDQELEDAIIKEANKIKEKREKTTTAA